MSKLTDHLNSVDWAVKLQQKVFFKGLKIRVSGTPLHEGKGS